MQKKAEEKKESAKDIIKQSMQSSLNKNDINFMAEDDGLLIDEDEDAVIDYRICKSCIKQAEVMGIVRRPRRVVCYFI